VNVLKHIFQKPLDLGWKYFNSTCNYY